MVALAGELSSRLMLSQELGSHNSQRSYYTTLGYPVALKFKDFKTMYEREGMAGRIVDLPAQDTWKKPPQITEGGNAETAFVKAWEELADAHKVWSVLSRLDKLTGLGRYGVLVIGTRGADLAEEVEPGSLSSPADVLYLRPLSEESAEYAAEDLVKDETDARYGLPAKYRIAVSPGNQVEVHWSHVIHVAEGCTDSELEGRPRLLRPYNALLDAIKLGGGTAEAVWLLMRQGTVITNKEGYTLDNAALESQIEAFLHDLARTLIAEGIEVGFPGGQMLDPTGAFDVTLSRVAAGANMPQRVVVGSAKGELAAAEYDAKEWAKEVRFRQSNFAEPEILRPFIDRLIELGALPQPKDSYDVGTQDDKGQWYWPPLEELSALEEAEVVARRATAIRAIRHPLTGEAPLSEIEQRDILGLPEESDTWPPEEPETVPATAPQLPRAPAEGPEAQPQAQASRVLYEDPVERFTITEDDVMQALAGVSSATMAKMVAAQPWHNASHKFPGAPDRPEDA
jgi:hypothetical protein